jgi:hypothetical protein
VKVKLQLVEQPKPVEPEYKMCTAKGCAYRAECLVPVGDDAVPMCWLCAHHVVEHGCTEYTAGTNECECLPHDIYPTRQAPPPVEKAPEPNLRELEREKLLSGPTKNLISWAREAHKQMSVSQHAAVKRRMN